MVSMVSMVSRASQLVRGSDRFCHQDLKKRQKTGITNLPMVSIAFLITVTGSPPGILVASDVSLYSQWFPNVSGEAPRGSEDDCRS